MIHDNLSFHNVAELESLPHRDGLALRRFPSSVRDCQHLSIGGLYTSRFSTGCEIRFVSDAPHCKLLVSSEEGGVVELFRGDYLIEKFQLEPGRVTQLGMAVPPSFADVDDAFFEKHHFAPTVWRLYCNSHTLLYHGIEDYGFGRRPPNEDELPKMRWLAYGSSITMGGQAYENYVNMAAIDLRVDPQNLGMAGSCFIEKEVSDFIVSLDTWDIATLELGVNMLGTIEPDEFERRATYLVDTLLARHPAKPVVLITVIRAKFHNGKPEDLSVKRMHAFNEILKKIAASHPDDNLHLVDGAELAADTIGYKGDLVHPDGRAYVLMGRELAAKLAPIVHG